MTFCSLFCRLLDEVQADKAEILSSSGKWCPCEDEEQVDVKPILDGDEDADIVVVGVVKKGRQDGRKRKLLPSGITDGDYGYYILSKIKI
jgi:hypothetical protein